MISIAMATYNGAKFIREQLDSILAQTITDWELIVCDDVSTDSTIAILEEYAKKDGRIQIHKNQVNLGFKRNFENHIDSLQKYNGQKGIFLIEQTGGMLFIDGTYPTVSYSLFFDKNLLEYIYKFKDVLQYVVFTNGEYVDIVKLGRIPKIMQYVPKEISFKAGRMCSIKLQCFIDLQM